MKEESGIPSRKLAKPAAGSVASRGLPRTTGRLIRKMGEEPFEKAPKPCPAAGSDLGW